MTGRFAFGGDGVVDRNCSPYPTCALNNAYPDPVLADVDNYPLGWSDPLCSNGPAIIGNECNKGPEDVDRDNDGVFDLGDAVDVTWTDSFDDDKPSGCEGDNGPGFENLDCFDGLRNFNQIRPTVFDGGWAFGPHFECEGGTCPDHVILSTNDNESELGYLKAGQYIVQGATPPGYRHIREEDKNVDFGDDIVPQLLPAECVGEPHAVQQWLAFQTYPDGTSLPDIAAGDLIESPFFGGPERMGCDMKSVRVTQGINAALDFHLMTEVPKAARVVGFILNDVANEFDPNSPNFGEKFAPPWLPVSFRDFTGREIARTYSDEFGKYNALLPSTFNVAVPMPSGMGPNMLTACMNASNPKPNPEFITNPDAPEFIPDPFHNPQYSQFCYTFQYMPGATTYLDTPVLPIAAFAGGGQFPLDCEFDNGVPLVSSVNRVNADGGGGPFVLPGQRIRIRSAGVLEVPNPEYDGTSATPKTIARNYQFRGNQGNGNAVLVAEDGMPVPLTINAWNNRRIIARVPSGTNVGTYQLVVTKHNGNSSPLGVTVTVGRLAGGTELAPSGGLVHNVRANGRGDFPTIQDAIDGAAPGDLILVGPGIYEELVIMYKPVSLQGWGAQVVTINAIKSPAEKLQDWRDDIEALFGSGAGNVFPNGLNGLEFDLLPGQELGFQISNNEPVTFRNGEAPGIMVLSHRGNGKPNSFRQPADPRIDGFTITGSDDAGGILVNGYADWLQISNNRIRSNAGFHGGGIRIGDAVLINETNAGVVHTDARNDRIRIHHNQITQNGALGGNAGAGGGVSIYTGADNYELTDNLICGNFALTNGGGVGHLGLSDNALIEGNTIIFNQSFNQGQGVSGGGIFVGGKGDPGVPGIVNDNNPAPVPQLLSTGSGSVQIVGNLIQGNQAGAGDGGGIRTARVSGADVLVPCTQANINNGQFGCDSRAEFRNQSAWHQVDIFNNIIANNMAGLAGGGISLQDTPRVRIANNTVANNDSTGSAGAAFPPNSPNQSDPQAAGVVSRAHSALLIDALNQTSDVTSDLPGWAMRDYSQPRSFQ
ncbi:MAG: hypothetical protein ACR2RB_21920, partial [Gammaproteobacteria bacterium]